MGRENSVDRMSMHRCRNRRRSCRHERRSPETRRQASANPRAQVEHRCASVGIGLRRLGIGSSFRSIRPPVDWKTADFSWKRQGIPVDARRPPAVLVPFQGMRAPFPTCTCRFAAQARPFRARRRRISREGWLFPVDLALVSGMCPCCPMVCVRIRSSRGEMQAIRIETQTL